MARGLAIVTIGLLVCSHLFAQQTISTSSGSGSSRHGSVVRHIDITWAQVAGAIGYRVLVRPLGGDVTIDERTTSTKLPVTLAPGTYQVRVVSFNIFDKPASVSPWHDIDVVRVYKPVVTLLSPKVLYGGRAAVQETIDGHHFLPETTVALTRRGKVIAQGAIDEIRNDQLKMRFNLLDVAPGLYDLRVSNPEHLVLVMPKALEVHPRVQPRLVSISIHAGYNDRAYRDVSVRGGGFVRGTGFFLERHGHRIEISNATIHSSKRASVDLDLGSAVPGRYDLVAANPGGKDARLRGAVTVVNITNPVFESMSPTSFTIGESRGVFALRARDMIPAARVYLRKDGRLVPTVALGPQRSSPSAGGHVVPSTKGQNVEARFGFSLSSTPAGRYDLVIANSHLLRTVVTGEVTVKPKPIPRLTGASVTHAYDTLDYKNVVLDGVNLKPSYGVVLQRGRVARDLVSRFVSSKRISVDMDFRHLSPGTYRVLVQSAGRTVASLPGGIRVTTPHQRYIHPSTIAVLFGYPYSLVLSPSFANAVSISTIAGKLTADFPLGVKFFPKLPGVRDMGIGITLGYSLYDDAATGSVSGTTSRIGMTTPGVDLYYRTPFNFPLNGVATVGYGISLSDFHSTSASATVSGSSLDFYYRLGAAARLDLGKRLVFDAGVEWMRVLYAETNLDTLELFVSGGLRFGK